MQYERGMGIALGTTERENYAEIGWKERKRERGMKHERRMGITQKIAERENYADIGWKERGRERGNSMKD